MAEEKKEEAKEVPKTLEELRMVELDNEIVRMSWMLWEVQQVKQAYEAVILQKKAKEKAQEVKNA